MTACLHAAAEDRENFRVGRRQKLCRRCGYCRGPHLRDQSSIHHREWCARFWIDQKNCCHVRRETAFCVRRVEPDGLYAKSIGSERRRHSKKSARLSEGTYL